METKIKSSACFTHFYIFKLLKGGFVKVLSRGNINDTNPRTLRLGVASKRDSKQVRIIAPKI